MRNALEITTGFRQIIPDDPVKYDFVLTRFGIRDDMNILKNLLLKMQISLTQSLPRILYF